MTQYTVNDVMRLNPCYTLGRVETLWADREGLTIADILELDIPVQDRLWAAWRLLPEQPRQVAITATVTRAIETYALKCNVPEVRVWAERWLSNVDRSTRGAAAAYAAAAAARAAAATAADDATAYAYAADAATRATRAAAAAYAADAAEAATDAAYAAYAAHAANYAAEAAYAAAIDAVYDAEHYRQIQDILDAEAAMREEGA